MLYQFKKKIIKSRVRYRRQLIYFDEIIFLTNKETQINF
jgi:hypothetical protein